MRVDSIDLLLFLGCASLASCVGAALRRSSRTAVLGWIFLFGGLAALAMLALALLTGRLGPEHLWFREPTFYIAACIILGATIWWLMRSAPRALRFGLPAVILLVLGVTMVLWRFDGRSAPLAMLMPTRDQPAPDLSYFDDGGRVRHLSELRGKVVLLNFWATWCIPCRREMPLLSRLQREHANDGLIVLYLSLEDSAVLRPFLAINRFDGVQGRIDRAPEFYNAGKFYPLSYLISRDGRVTRRWSGRPKEDWLRAAIADALR
jgi:thiol-disulfide isomerase/thioredoxin